MRNVSKGRYRDTEEIRALYRVKKRDIYSRLEEFRQVWHRGSNQEIFTELIYCIITPMARGKMCCTAVDAMVRTGVLFTGTKEQIKPHLIGARFIHKKSAYIVEAREKFIHDGSVTVKAVLDEIDDDRNAREWLVDNIKGIGYKEASHFLRNIGFSRNLAILDRHIIRNLHSFGVVEEITDSLSKRRYLDIEERMREFSHEVRIPMAHLDLLLWCKETGEILK